MVLDLEEMARAPRYTTGTAVDAVSREDAARMLREDTARKTLSESVDAFNATLAKEPLPAIGRHVLGCPRFCECSFCTRRV